MQKALITGGSSGIGLELARLMADKGHDLVLVARDLDKLEAVKAELGQKVNVEIIDLDLAERGSIESLWTKTKDKNIEILVNSAGFGLVGDFFDEDISKNSTMIDLNVSALVELNYCFGRMFRGNNRGRILNIASIAAFVPGPKQPVYYASKAFVRSFSRATSHNLKNTGVSVTVLNPGPTKTNFFKAADAESHTNGASPVSVAKVGYEAMMRGDTEVTHGLMNKLLTNFLVRIIPYRLQANLVDRSSDI